MVRGDASERPQTRRKLIANGRKRSETVILAVSLAARAAPCRLNYTELVGSVAERLACWTQAQKGPGSNRSRDAVCRVTVLGKLFTPIVPLFTKQQNW